MAETNITHDIIPAPPAETQERPAEFGELLRPEHAGLQASLLLNAELPDPQAGLDDPRRQRLNTIKDAITNNRVPENSDTVSTNASLQKRDEYWTGHADPMTEFLEKTNAILAQFGNHADQARILNDKFGISTDNGAQALYDTYFRQNNGRTGFLSLQISNLTREELSLTKAEVITVTMNDGTQRNISILDTLKTLYGEEADDLALEDQAEAYINIKHNSDQFIATAEAQFHQGDNMPGRDKLAGINELNRLWEEKVAQRQIDADEAERQRRAAEAERQRLEEEERQRQAAETQARQQMTQAYQAIENDEIASGFGTVLTNIESKPESISREDHLALLREIQNAFVLYQANLGASESNKILSFLSIYNSIEDLDERARTNQTPDQTIMDYYNNIFNEFRNYLQSKAVQINNYPQGTDFNPAIMREVAREDVDDENMIDKVIRVNNLGFSYQNNVLRQAGVVLGRRRNP
jgi:molecular chaperone GrpE (heat shock protein)